MLLCGVHYMKYFFVLFIERVRIMSTTSPIQGRLFPEDEHSQNSQVGEVGATPMTHVSVVADEDFHDEQLPWAQEGEGLL